MVKIVVEVVVVAVGILRRHQRITSREILVRATAGSSNSTIDIGIGGIFVVSEGYEQVLGRVLQGFVIIDPIVVETGVSALSRHD